MLDESVVTTRQSADMSQFVHRRLDDSSRQTHTVEAPAAAMSSSSLVHEEPQSSVYHGQQAAPGPLRKLSVDLIHTYKHINEVCVLQFGLR